MENYLLCGAVSNLNSPSSAKFQNNVVTLYKGRKRGTVEFVGIWRHSRAAKDLVTNNVKYLHKLNHGNIIKFCEWYETSKHVWVITELASGGTLAQILEQDNHIPPGKISDFFTDISSGLRYLHSVDILYGDLQPSKIVLDTCCNLKLCDFALAVTASQDTVWPSQTDFRSAVKEWLQLGSHSRDSTVSSEVGEALSLADRFPCPLYASPELYQGAGLTAAGDLWALGCMTFEMLTGHQPFYGHGSVEALEAAVCCGWSAVAVVDMPSSGSRGEGRLLDAWFGLVRGLLATPPSQRLSWGEVNCMLKTSLSPGNNDD